MVAVGAAIAGVLLLNVATQDIRVLPLTVILVWSQGLLIAGTTLGIWLVLSSGSGRQKND